MSSCSSLVLIFVSWTGPCKSKYLLVNIDAINLKLLKYLVDRCCNIVQSIALVQTCTSSFDRLHTPPQKALYNGRPTHQTSEDLSLRSGRREEFHGGSIPSRQLQWRELVEHGQDRRPDDPCVGLVLDGDQQQRGELPLAGRRRRVRGQVEIPRWVTGVDLE